MKAFVSLTSVALLAVSSSAFADPISIDLVGGADTLVSWASLSNSGDDAERNFISGYLGVSADTITYTHLTDAVSGGGSGAWNTVTDNSSLYAFDFGSVTPAYFLIRTGNGVGLVDLPGTYTHFLYENVSALNYGVLDLSVFTRDRGQIEIGMVSHVSTSGGTTSVPEPATLGLLGIALAGGLGFGRRKKSA